MATITVPNALVLDLVEWVAKEPRAYADVMDAWRTSCPRLQIWEEAQDLGYVERFYDRARGASVRATEAGRAALVSAGRPVPSIRRSAA